ncbi:hypothetical protein AQPE_2092 [Aquipluma nitroreducens]|uniref:Uncharacterized protein n=1 Tax=Aquipluma nitroreducens TaxID=2010828 RepID=A0A5K7S8P6_9BACT|nr:hypothetical protein AQPE_2092 [Aquipluma nitroreducens]
MVIAIRNIMGDFYSKLILLIRESALLSKKYRKKFKSL